MSAVAAERWPLDRLCVDDATPLVCEVERIVDVLDRLAASHHAEAGATATIMLRDPGICSCRSRAASQ